MSTPPGRLRPRPLAERGRAVVLVVALLVLLAAVAATAAMSRPGAGPTHGYTLPPAALFGWGAALAVVTGLALTLVGPFWSNREKWTAFLVAMLLLLGFAILAERSYDQVQRVVQQPQQQATAAPQPQATPTPPRAQPTAHAQPVPPPAVRPTTSVPPWVLAVAGAGALLLAAVALRFAGRAGGGVGAGRAPAAAELDAAVERSMADVAAETDPRRAIVSAWLAMGDTLARHGMRRHPWEPPVEYMQRALRTMRVRRESAQRLTALFQRARYSDHPTTPAMRDDALSALQSVRDDLHEDSP